MAMKPDAANEPTTEVNSTTLACKVREVLDVS